MYMQGFKCNVTGATSTTPVAPAQAPVYCGDGNTPCVQGAKQMIAWNQASGVNVFPPSGISPGYNTGMGWTAGAQSDIFGAASPGAQSSSSSAVVTSATSSASISIAAPPPMSSLSSAAQPIISSTTIPTASFVPPVAQPVSTTPISSLTASAPLSFSSTTFETRATPVSPITAVPISATSTISASSTTGLVAPTGASPEMFADFVKWMEAAWAEWVESQGAS